MDTTSGIGHDRQTVLTLVAIIIAAGLLSGCAAGGVNLDYAQGETTQSAAVTKAQADRDDARAAQCVRNLDDPSDMGPCNSSLPWTTYDKGPVKPGEKLCVVYPQPPTAPGDDNDFLKGALLEGPCNSSLPPPKGATYVMKSGEKLCPIYPPPPRLSLALKQALIVRCFNPSVVITHDDTLQRDPPSTADDEAPLPVQPTQPAGGNDAASLPVTAAENRVLQDEANPLLQGPTEQPQPAYYPAPVYQPHYYSAPEAPPPFRPMPRPPLDFNVLPHAAPAFVPYERTPLYLPNLQSTAPIPAPPSVPMQLRVAPLD